ncbi:MULTISPECIES: ABC transporter substrate-binding protein [unclassified Pantoea]|uniref:ABC transporter substrate-binding protein n=1 Tax=unclassified Pantoea TaxID=2630326 RepID=UPI001CD48E07|nr:MULTISPECIES: ABC transporter substrate-binding protein [unclassified Pantoea]MCA1177805.1 ABC transporter substrate-binding protein [Pantoea sp. alder69]MCA1252932.1 ABC transporter substrate-binding protein [Pantoea sp. alder70]MCA1266431.1 ABC transporter substrate-binding protein [Pantoea sp. alder81]
MFSLHAVKKSVSYVCCFSLFTLAAHSVYAAEAAPIKMGVEPWLGYGQWHIASAKDLFAKSGLKKVEVINFAEDKDINAALASGQIDAANIATHTAMGMISAGLPVKIVLVLDQSNTADAILASKEVGSVKDLKGKQVAYEEGTTSDILLRSALASAGLSFSDIKPVPMPAASAGSAILAGRVPVAVTYEPYLSVAKKSDPSIKMLYSGSSDPGLISDVLVVRDDFIKSHPDEIKSLIKTWGAALDFYNANTTEGRAIISKAVGATPEDLDTAFDGVKYFTLSENKAYLSHDFTTKTFPHILKAATEAGIVTQPVTPAQTIDAEFANQQ